MKIAVLRRRLNEGLSFENWKEDYQWGYFYEHKEIKSMLPKIKLAVLIHASYLIYSFKVLICALFDHKLIDESYGNPETGCIDLTCSRCGMNYRQTLY